MENKKEKKDKISLLVTIVLAGILLLVIAIPANGRDATGQKVQSADGTAEKMTQTAAYYERRLKDILEHSYGTGTMEVMVHVTEVTDGGFLYGNEEVTAKVDGVLVVAQVKDSQAVSDITFAVCALFDLPAHKVAVMIKK